MDIQMPIMDGYESTIASSQFEKDHALQPTPIIALSAHSTDVYKKKAIEVGMNHFCNYSFSYFNSN